MRLIAVVLASGYAVEIHHSRNQRLHDQTRELIVDAGGEAREPVLPSVQKCKDNEHPPEGDNCIRWYTQYCEEHDWGLDDVAANCGKFRSDYIPCELCSKVVGEIVGEIKLTTFECDKIYNTVCEREVEEEDEAASAKGMSESDTDSESDAEEAEEDSDDGGESDEDDDEDDKNEDSNLARNSKKETNRRGKKNKPADDDDDIEVDASCEGGQYVKCEATYGTWCDGYPCGRKGPLSWTGCENSDITEVRECK